ncbi:MAG: hypothetical protein ACOYXS_05325 [Chloroflexota bacterium]
MIRASIADILAIPLGGGEPIDLGIAGYQRRSPDDSENRLSTPAWSSDSRRIAFENRSVGTIVSLDTGSREGFAARPDALITPAGYGFIIIGPTGRPQAVGGARVSPVAALPGLDPLGYLAEGTSLVGVGAGGELLWSDGYNSRTISASLDDRGWRVFARSGDTLIIAPEGRRLDFGVFIIAGTGSVTELELPDACGIPDVSDDQAYAAYTVCDNSGAADSYGIRLVRLVDGAALDLRSAAGSPRFVPGTHRLAWLALSGQPPIAPLYTVSLAANEVVP